MAHIVVMGGGIAGLATALFLARGAHDVTLFEQDATETSGDLDEDFFGRPRPRVPQAVQPHALLGPARSVLRTRTPDVYAQLLRLGAWEQHEFDWFTEHPPYRPGDEDLVLVRLRRVVLETALRAAVHAHRNVRVESGTAVHGLVVGPGGGRAPRVTGVRLAAGQVAADLVVDATGRRSPVATWLARAGAPAPRTRRHRVGLAYACRWYRAHPGAMTRTRLPHVPYTSARCTSWPASTTGGAPPPTRRAPSSPAWCGWATPSSTRTRP
jgi:2-polyprenyl-6-methoxyphenol hydroxylase-like FAD-dependent oxidoreductase